MNEIGIGVITSVFSACLLSTAVPWMNSEAAVAAGALTLPGGWTGLLVGAAALGQTLGKLALYALVRRSPDGLPARLRAVLDRIARVASGRSASAATVFAGAVVGLPPLYLVTVVAGLTRMPAGPFASSALAGVTLRYAAIAWGATRVAQALN